jgi:cobalamin biosynthesis protein CobD/CbiB
VTTTVDQTAIDQEQPIHGFTRLGQAVHKRTVDHLPTESRYQRLNKAVAIALTKYIGTMTCFWVFCILALFSLPAVLSGFSVFHSVFPAVLIKASIIALVAWVAQTFIQLVLLPALMVGQNLQNEAADARATKTFEDVEDARNSIKQALVLLDINTEGGLKVVLDAIESLKTT